MTGHRMTGVPEEQAPTGAGIPGATDHGLHRHLVAPNPGYQEPRLPRTPATKNPGYQEPRLPRTPATKNPGYQEPRLPRTPAARTPQDFTSQAPVNPRHPAQPYPDTPALPGHGPCTPAISHTHAPEHPATQAFQGSSTPNASTPGPPGSRIHRGRVHGYAKTQEPRRPGLQTPRTSNPRSSGHLVHETHGAPDIWHMKLMDLRTSGT